MGSTAKRVRTVLEIRGSVDSGRIGVFQREGATV